MLCKIELCTGCAACQDICPNYSAEMVQNAEGFWVPEINGKSCTACGKCEKVCPALNKTERPEHKIAYSGYSKNPQMLRRSSSGGIFSVLSEQVLKQGGVVFGTAFDEGNYSVSCRSTEEVALASLCKSKYIESDTAGVYQKIYVELEKGRSVLFCSTPCKISAMAKYAVMRGISCERLILMDFVCHGVPSPFVWQDYLQSKEAQYGSKCESVDFRCKEYGWDFSNVLKLSFQNGKIYYGDLIGDPWYRLYVKRIGLRPSCYRCNAMGHSAADITAADFLGASLAQRKAHAGGLSLILPRSSKGHELIQKISDEMVLHLISPKEFEYIFKTQDNSREEAAGRRLYHAFLSGGFSVEAFAKSHGGVNVLRGKCMRNRVFRDVANAAYRFKKKVNYER